MRLNPLAVVFLTQILFTTSDFLARSNLKTEGLTWASILAPWFFAYLLVRQVAMVGQLYVFANVELGKTAGFFALSSLLIANIAGPVFLNDSLSVQAYVGVAIACVALVVIALAK